MFFIFVFGADAFYSCHPSSRRSGTPRLPRPNPHFGSPKAAIFLHGRPCDIHKFCRCRPVAVVGGLQSDRAASVQLWHDALSFKRHSPQWLTVGNRRRRPSSNGGTSSILRRSAQRLERNTSGCSRRLAPHCAALVTMRGPATMDGSGCKHLSVVTDSVARRIGFGEDILYVRGYRAAQGSHAQPWRPGRNRQRAQQFAEDRAR